jgi:hypothetical protein
MKEIERKFPRIRTDYKRSSRRRAQTRVRRALRNMKAHR